uniref:hypothetical protein n=1 Tax=Thaumasiovibrio occultus TaxID=1891184 RepID=UPI000B34E92E|nr:hypothetical protein [Thaumasiovibrio occultus]
MEVIDEAPGLWHFLKHHGQYFLSARCDYSYATYSFAVRLTREEALNYRREGPSVIDELAKSIHYSTPGLANRQSRFDKRKLRAEYQTMIAEAIAVWNSDEKRARKLKRARVDAPVQESEWPIELTTAPAPEQLVELETPFSVADAQYPVISQKSGTLRVEYVDWQEICVVIVFHDCEAFRWQGLVALQQDEHDDRCYQIQNSHWLDQHVRAKLIVEEDAFTHFRFNFNENGSLEVIAQSYTVDFKLSEHQN